MKKCKKRNQGSGRWMFRKNEAISHQVGGTRKFSQRRWNEGETVAQKTTLYKFSTTV